MFKKKFLSIMLLIGVLLLSLGGVYANSTGQSNNIPDQKEALKCYKVIMDHNMSKFGKYFPENYSGSFIDDDGNLNINLVNDPNYTGENEEALKKLVKSDKVKYHYVKYTMNYLDNIIKTLNGKMIDLDIAALERDEQKNKVYIYIKDLKDDEKINKIKRIVDSPAIEFRQQENKITTTATDLINGTAFSSTGENFTLGFGAKKSDGTVGYVFPGHISASVGYNVKLGTGSQGTAIGSVTTKKFSGSTDASFITKSGTTYQPSKYLGSVLASYSGTVALLYSYPQNTALTAWGYVSGKQTGSILSSSCSFNYSEFGVVLTDMVKSSYKAIKGDSGAPVCIGTGPNSYSLAGMQSGSLLDSNNNWYSDSFSAFSKLHHILNDLDITTTP